MKAQLTTAVLFLLPALSLAQVPVDENGNVIGNFESQADVMPLGEDGIPRLSQTELQELVGPIALYPDDLLAIVLPASAYPLQIVEAARFLEALESDPTLKPDPDWDDSIVALINYPEVVELLNEDLDWTWRLGEAVVSQQTDVIAAVEAFRDRAYAAGNLKSDEYQTVSNDDGAISISPAAEDVIYVPYYEPARVVYYQPRPVYYYHPHAYPVYYYPYAANHHFHRGFFWGVTTAFSIGWYTDSLNVFHHSYHGHPYYGRTYWNDGWYRRPSISVYNTTYVNYTNVTVNRHSSGDQWRARDSRREYVRREGYARTADRSAHRSVANTRQYEPITFREREGRVVNRDATPRQSAVNRRPDTRRQEPVLRTRTTNQEPAARTRDTSRDATTNRSRSGSTYRPEPVRQTRDQATTRTQQRAPQPREQRHVESRSRTQPSHTQPTRSQSARSQPTRAQPRQSQSTRSQPARAQPTRSSEPRSSESNSSRPESRSSETRSRSKDRQH